MAKKKESGLLLENRVARHEYFFFDTFVAGLVLKGTEIKSLRRRDASLSDAYIYVKDEEAFIANMHIAPYKEGNIFNVDHLRDRKLLLQKREIAKIANSLKQGGYTCVPTKIFLQHGFAKVEIVIAKGKKTYDKRESLKQRDLQRELERSGHRFGGN